MIATHLGHGTLDKGEQYFSHAKCGAPEGQLSRRRLVDLQAATNARDIIRLGKSTSKICRTGKAMQTVMAVHRDKAGQDDPAISANWKRHHMVGFQPDADPLADGMVVMRWHEGKQLLTTREP